MQISSMCVKILEQSSRGGCNVPENKPMWFSLSIDSFRKEIYLFFIPCWCFFTTCCLWKKWVLVFYTFQKTAGLHLKLNLENDHLFVAESSDCHLLDSVYIVTIPLRPGFCFSVTSSVTSSKHKGKWRSLIAKTYLERFRYILILKLSSDIYTLPWRTLP